MQPANSRQQLLEAIAQLSDRQLSIVLRFIQTFQSNSISTPVQPSIAPLANFIGATTNGNLAQAIDDALHSELIPVEDRSIAISNSNVPS